ncbi:xylose isomerase [Phyllobacterium salinisoli]|uniref:Xylose isomerase n=1 Tax=Phyllobacterium salinisoli TaxID=1899321 RepID=A0A368K114_9HYPH|nr:TIM barrel protein [Phyllobacterium salinisoli]RCS22864.1 xylose isomerase [Phyllobacterium salinisoli]
MTYGTALRRFALNHMTVPGLGMPELFGLASTLGIKEVEIRNDLSEEGRPGKGDIRTVSAGQARRLAEDAGVTIISINALQRFNEWTPARAAEAVELADYAQASGARALVLVPVNDGTGQADGERQRNLREALKALKPILAERGLVGLVEPLGFEICSLRSKREASEAMAEIGGGDVFRLVHDTFHHALAGEDTFFPGLTGLVHISGVADPARSHAQMLDAHRGLVDEKDRLGNADQIRILLDGGYRGPLSFEAFAREVHDLQAPGQEIAASMAFIGAAVDRMTGRTQGCDGVARAFQ